MHTTSLNLDNFGNFLNFRFKSLLFSKIQVACQPRPRFLILHSTTVRLNGTFAVADPENFGGGDFKHKTAKIRKSSPKLRVIFRPKSEIQTIFSPKIRCSQKKKKKKRSSPKLRVIFRPKSEIQTFFSPKIRCSPTTKKKRSSPKLRVIFRPKSEIQTIFSPKIRCSPKKNKKNKKTRSSPKLRVIFRPKSLRLGWWGDASPPEIRHCTFVP